MNAIATPQLAAAVSNAGGLGVIGGVGYTPDQLRQLIKEVKEDYPPFSDAVILYTFITSYAYI